MGNRPTTPSNQVSPEDIEQGRIPAPKWTCPRCQYANRFQDDGPCGNPKCNHVRRKQDPDGAGRESDRVRGPRATGAQNQPQRANAGTNATSSHFSSGGGGGGSNAGVSNPGGPPSREADDEDDDDDALIARAIAAANVGNKNRTPASAQINRMRGPGGGGGGTSVRTVIASCNRVRELITGCFDLDDLRVLFAVVDTNGDEELSLVEFSAFVEGCVRNRKEDWDETVEISDADVEEVFTYIDKDHSGVIARRYIALQQRHNCLNFPAFCVLVCSTPPGADPCRFPPSLSPGTERV